MPSLVQVTPSTDGTPWIPIVYPSTSQAQRLYTLPNRPLRVLKDRKQSHMYAPYSYTQACV